MIVFALILIGAFVIVAAAQGLGDPNLDDGEVAQVEEAPDGTITQEAFDRALEQTAARQGLREVPPEDDPQYALLKDAAMSDLLLARWVAGEAEERGIEVTDREVDEELDRAIEQEFGGDKQFQKFLEQSGFTEEEARERIELRLISDRIQQNVLPEEPAISDEEIEAFYDENQTQFEQPETRDVRVVLTKTEEEAADALAELEQDDSEQSWEQVAKQFSIDEATKSTGGLREAVVEGQSEPALDEQIFNAAEGELVGPFETDAGFYVIQLQAITPGSTTSLEDATEQIRQTLIGARQQEIAESFQESFTSKWTARTFCAEGYETDRCSNAPPPPDACEGDDEGEDLPVDPTTGEPQTELACDAPVPSTRPVAPGTAGVFGAPAPQGLPQGPITPQAEAPAGLPPGISPLPGGAAPPGAVPPGGAPPGTAAPGTAPPGTAPPGTAPPAPPPGG
jgi:foldase protein PrsA